MPEHLRLAKLKSISGRLHALQVLERWRGTFDREQLNKEFGMLLEVVDSAARGVGVLQPDPSGTLKEFVGEILLHKLEDQIRGMPRLSEPRLNGESAASLIAVQLIANLREGLADPDCDKCVQSGPSRCDGRDVSADSERVALRGLCIAPLRELYEVALRVSRAWYVQCAPSFAAAPPRVIVDFNTRARDQDELYDFACPLCVSGKVGYERPGASPESAVWLQVSEQGFDWRSHLASLYVLFHECVVHVFQGLIPAGSRRDEARSDERFSEGWMDYVAFEMMRRFLLEKDVPDPLMPFEAVRDRPGSFLREGEALHLLRRSPQGAIAGTRRQEGWEAASKLLNLLGHARRDQFRQGWRDFLNVSLELNLMAGVVEEREDLVDALRTGLDYPIRTPPSACHAAFASSISYFLADNDLRGRGARLFKSIGEFVDMWSVQRR